MFAVWTTCPICQGAFNSSAQKFNANGETKFAVRSRASRLPLMDFCTPGSETVLIAAGGGAGDGGNRAKPHLLIQPVHRAKAIPLI